MQTWPQIIVGGFPNSGTSFLCHLVSEMGFSAGSPHYLKPPDTHNQWGYWEHLIVRMAAWKGLLPQGYLNVFGLPNSTLTRNNNIASLIQFVAKIDKVQVYKDNALPVIWRSFSPEAKYILIRRSPRDCYLSPGRAGMPGYSCGFTAFETAYNKYRSLELQMSLAHDMDLLIVHYEDFCCDLTRQIQFIIDFLEVEEPDLERLKATFRPRNRLSGEPAQRMPLPE